MLGCVYQIHKKAGTLADFIIRRGGTVKWRLVVNEPRASVNDPLVPMDITGATWEVLQNDMSEGFDPTIQVTDGPNGVAELVDNDAEGTKNLSVGEHNLRIKYILATGEHRPLRTLVIEVQ